MKNSNKTLALAAVAAVSMFSAQNVNAQSAFDFNEAANVEMMETASFADDGFTAGDTDFSFYAAADGEKSYLMDYVLSLVKNPKYKEAFTALKNLPKITKEDIKTTLKAVGLGYMIIEFIVTIWTHRPLIFHILG